MLHRMIRMLAVVVLCVCCLLYSVGKAEAYGNAVHINATRNAVAQSDLDSYVRDYLGFPEGNRKVLLDPRLSPSGYGYYLQDWIATGGYLEDGGMENASELSTRAFNHFHDPLRPWARGGLDSIFSSVYWYYYDVASPASALAWALQPGVQTFSGNTTGDWAWSRAREEFYAALTGISNGYRSERFANCFRSLGQVMHLVEDMSVPLHTRNDPHILPLTFWDRYWGDWTYETYVEENAKRLPYVAHRPNQSLLTVSIRDIDLAGIPPVSGLYDRNLYTGGDIPNSDELGLAEFSHANFLTSDTIMTAGGYPHPAPEDVDCDGLNQEPEFVVGEDGRLDLRPPYVRKVVGEQVQHLAAVGYWAPNLVPNPAFDHGNIWCVCGRCYPLVLDETCWAEYAQKLIPRAVGYASTLLEYFFRGRIHIGVPGDGFYAMTTDADRSFMKVKLKATNVTAHYEDMSDGQIHLVVKYRLAAGNPFQNDPSNTSPEFYYLVVPEKKGVQALPNGQPIDLEFDLSPGIPLWATDVHFQVVFKGRIGWSNPDTYYEDDAVAVGYKDVHEPTPLYLYNNMDKVCLDAQWLDAGSDTAIGYVDDPVRGGDDDGTADEWDVYTHDLENIYFRTSPIGALKYPSPAPGNHHHYVEYLAAGMLDRSMYVIADETFYFSVLAYVKETDPADPWGHLYAIHARTQPSIKNQIEWDGARWVRHVPHFYEFRGEQFWGGVMIENQSYPDPDDLEACPYEDLN